MDQQHFQNLTATLAAGLVPVMLVPGHVTPARLGELAETAVTLASLVAKAARERYPKQGADF